MSVSLYIHVCYNISARHIAAPWRFRTKGLRKDGVADTRGNWIKEDDKKECRAQEECKKNIYIYEKEGNVGSI